MSDETTGQGAQKADPQGGDREGVRAPARLVWHHGKGLEESFPLHPDGPTIFGRDRGCDHRLRSRYFSRRHFTVLPVIDGYILLDLGSRNGTFIQDRWIRVARLDDGVAVRAGDRLLLFESGLDEEASLCRSCGTKLASGSSTGDTRLCLVCRHRYPLLGEEAVGVQVLAPHAERPGLVDYLGREKAEDREVRLRIFEGGRYRRALGGVRAFEHARAVRVLVSGKHEGAGVLITDRPSRVTLASLVQTRLPAPDALVVGLMRGTARALREAHRAGLMHGALRPESVGVDEVGEAEIDDLGLHDILRPKTSDTDWFVPPERRGERRKASRIDDIYAFGATFYQLLTRRPPLPDFAGGQVSAARPLASRRPDLSGRTTFVIGRALANDTKQRYRNFDEILSDLE
jgi:Protein kinase domain/FHA domain